MELDGGSINVVVVLGRRLLGMICRYPPRLCNQTPASPGTVMTIYLPTLLLVAISYAVNFFRPADFGAGVCVNLTCMLVLATMFVSVSDSLPKTSYIKMVDIWLVTTLCIPFLEVAAIVRWHQCPYYHPQVLIHTAIDTYRDQDPEGEGGVDLRRDNDDREFKKFNNFIKSGAADAGTEEKNPDLK